MKEAGCIREAQSWELMIKSMQGTNKEAAWSEQNFRSWFEDPPSESLIPDNLNQAYEVMNSSSVSHIVWTDDGIFIFTLTVIDPEFSCGLKSFRNVGRIIDLVLSNTDYLAFNLTSWETSSETQGIGVTTRDVNAVIKLKNKLPGSINRLSESPVEVSFAIKTFSEDSACSTLKAETTVTVGCPPFRQIFPRGKPSSCDGFQNFSFIIPRGQRKDIFLEGHDTSDKLVDYDLEKLGCPFKILKNEAFKPVIDLYDGELFLEEVDANYVLWEQQGRAGFEYSATMKEARCVREAQSWKQMVKAMEGTNKEAAWTKQNFRSCFEDPPSESVISNNLNQAYDNMNSSPVSPILWIDDGIFIFTLTVIDP